MGVTQKILESLKKLAPESEMMLWHGTGVHPDDLAKGAKSLVEPKFSSDFFKKGTGRMVQGPGLYASEEKGVGKRYADVVGGFAKSTEDKLVKGTPILYSLDDVAFNNEGIKKYGLSQLLMLNESAMMSKGGSALAPDRTFAENKNSILKNLRNMIRSTEKAEYANPADGDDIIQLYNFISPLKKKDFSENTERYLYKVAFPKERYLDWYERSPESLEILDTAKKDLFIPKTYYATPKNADSIMQLLQIALHDKFVDKHADEFRKIMELSQSSNKIHSDRAIELNEMLHEQSKRESLPKIVDIFERAGFAGTKYRGDQQRGDYFNYVLLKPERARILDAFKFGLGGASMLPMAGSQGQN